MNYNNAFVQTNQQVGNQVNIGGGGYTTYSYEFHPQEDISAYELALCIKILLCNPYDLQQSVINAPLYVKRHFKVK